PHASLLFPYPPVFRSQRLFRDQQLGNDAARSLWQGGRRISSRAGGGRAGGVAAPCRRLARRTSGAAVARAMGEARMKDITLRDSDRKSTRLNSSHVKI